MSGPIRDARPAQISGHEPPPERRGTAVGPRVAALAAFAIAVGLFFGFGGYDWFRDTDRIVALLVGTGVVGPLLFIFTMWLVQPLGVPGVVWMVPAGVLWPWPLAIAVCWVGNLGASSVGFAFSRWVGRDWVEPRLPHTVRRFDRRLERGGLAPVVALRVVTGQLAPADWLLGVSAVRWPAFLVGTAIGIVPQLVLFVVAGSSLLLWLAAQPTVVWIVSVLIAAVAVVALRIRAREPVTTP